jgi:tartrate-resistant acid phosphatase type 5
LKFFSLTKKSEKASKIKFDYIVSMGDNFYWEGVDNVTDPLFQTVYENVYNIYDSLRPLDWFLILGNHDWRKPNSADSEIEYHKFNKKWNMPHYFYTKEIFLKSGERIQQIFIDTTRFDLDYRIEYPHVARQSLEEMINWLSDVLQTGSEMFKWRFVYGHHVIYSGGDYSDWGHEFMKPIEDLFQKHKIDAYFCGHQHILQFDCFF